MPSIRGWSNLNVTSLPSNLRDLQSSLGWEPTLPSGEDAQTIHAANFFAPIEEELQANATPRNGGRDAAYCLQWPNEPRAEVLRMQSCAEPRPASTQRSAARLRADLSHQGLASQRVQALAARCVNCRRLVNDDDFRAASARPTLRQGTPRMNRRDRRPAPRSRHSSRARAQVFVHRVWVAARSWDLRAEAGVDYARRAVEPARLPLFESISTRRSSAGASRFRGSVAVSARSER